MIICGVPEYAEIIHDQSAVSVPLPFAVGTKVTPPLLSVMQDTVMKGDSLFISSDKNGTIYLVTTSTTPENLGSYDLDV